MTFGHISFDDLDSTDTNLSVSDLADRIKVKYDSAMYLLGCVQTLFDTKNLLSSTIHLRRLRDILVDIYRLLGGTQEELARQSAVRAVVETKEQAVELAKTVASTVGSISKWLSDGDIAGAKNETGKAIMFLSQLIASVSRMK